MKAEWVRLRSKDCTDCFTADAVANFFPRTCVDKHKKMTRELSDSSKWNSYARRCYVYVAKFNVAMMLQQTYLHSLVEV